MVVILYHMIAKGPVKGPLEDMGCLSSEATNTTL